MSVSENQEYLSTQLITYIGNKRSLIYEIEKEIVSIKKELCKEKCICADLFSGSGIVARMMKKHSSVLIANDLENYSALINSCYLSNRNQFDESIYNEYRTKIDSLFNEQNFFQNAYEGIITQNYAPKDDNNIQMGERVFYTHSNALKIDTYRKLIDECVTNTDYTKYFLAPLLTEASIHVNTSGVFKGFYKDKKTGIGCFGGSGKNALPRILGNIELKKPVFSNFSSELQIYQKDTVELSKELKDLDIVYLDPPYNQHPYGSNYFMLNLIIKNKIEAPISNVSGIVDDWNRSAFNKAVSAFSSMESIISSIDAKFIIISYNSEGFISFDQMKNMLTKYGSLKTIEISYNTFRGCRNLHDRNIHVSEYLFILKKE